MIEINMNSMDGVVLMTAGKKIEENIKVTPVASLILPEYDGAYELLVPAVSGVWVFNETLPRFENGDSIEYDIAFTSNGKSYTFIECYNTPGPVGDVTMNYFVEKTGIVGPDWDNAYNSGWANDDYRLVDFGTTAQEVSEEFLAWLTANAVKQ